MIRSMKFIFARADVPNAKGEVFSKEALYKLQEEIFKRKTLELKDAKGSYEARVYHCYMENDCLMIEAEVR